MKPEIESLVLQLNLARFALDNSTKMDGASFAFNERNIKNTF